MKRISFEPAGSDKIAYFLLLGLFVFIAGLSYFLPYQRDDFLYAFIWNTPRRIHSLTDIAESLRIHYLTWGGRLVPVFIMQYFQLIGKGFFAVVNGLMYTALVLLIYWHALGRISRKLNSYVVSIIIVGSWFALPDYAFTAIWACGTANYLWPAVLILWTLLPYHVSLINAEDEAAKSDSGVFKALGMFVLACVASLTMENAVLTMCLALVCMTFYAYRSGCWRGWMLAGTLGSIIGTGILLLAPGNFARVATTHTHWYNHIANFFGAHVQILLGLLPVVLLIVLALKLFLKENIASLSDAKLYFGRGFFIKSIIVILLAVSNLSGHFVSHALTVGIINYILVPLGLSNDRVYARLSYALSSTEAVLIYILACVMLYNLGKQILRLQEIALVKKIKELPHKELYTQNRLFWQRLGIVFLLALIHNGAMLFSPQFPARAGFGSAVYVLIMMAMLLLQPRVYERLIQDRRRAWAVILFLAFVPMAVETWAGSQTLYEENKAREQYIYEQTAAGKTVLTLKKFSVETSVLRHIYFSDMDSDFARGCALPYYGLKQVKIEK